MLFYVDVDDFPLDIGNSNQSSLSWRSGPEINEEQPQSSTVRLLALPDLILSGNRYCRFPDTPDSRLGGADSPIDKESTEYKIALRLARIGDEMEVYLRSVGF